MPPKSQRRLVLSAGEECTITSDGLVQITLLSGTLDIAGVLLEPNQPHVTYLSSGCRALVVFTLEGGSGSITSEGALELHKSVAGAAALVQLTRRTLLTARQSTVLIIGEHRRGKTLAAHTVGNLLVRYAEEQAGGLGGRPLLVDLNAATNSLFSPGCVSVLQVPEPAQLLLGHTSAPSLLPLSFYTGAAVRPSIQTIGTFLHFAEQLVGTARILLAELSGDVLHRQHVVVDAPSPLPDLQPGVFYKKLIEVVRPTHVVIVGDREDPSHQWSEYLQEDVQRVLPDCAFTYCPPVAKPPAASDAPLLLQEYFVGNPFYPLGVTKVVVSAQQVTFVELATDVQGAVVARREVPVPSWRSLVCALSHADVVEEVPLAPTAGLLIISYVDEEHDEVGLLIPSADTVLQRRFIVVPSTSQRSSLCLSNVQIASVEECVAA